MICINCGSEKIRCKQLCAICYRKKYREDNKQQIKNLATRYYHKNKETIKKYNLDLYYSKKDIIIPHMKRYRLTNKESIKKQKQETYLLNKKTIDEKNKKRWSKNYKRYNKNAQPRRRERYKTDYEHKIKMVLSSRMRAVLKRNKSKSCIELLGADVKTVRQHIEQQFMEGMTWENHGQYGWHIDHIKPIAKFDLTDVEQQKECFHYTNLQPLWWRPNLYKGVKC